MSPSAWSEVKMFGWPRTEGLTKYLWQQLNFVGLCRQADSCRPLLSFRHQCMREKCPLARSAISSACCMVPWPLWEVARSIPWVHKCLAFKLPLSFPIISLRAHPSQPHIHQHNSLIPTIAEFVNLTLITPGLQIEKFVWLDEASVIQEKPLSSYTTSIGLEFTLYSENHLKLNLIPLVFSSLAFSKPSCIDHVEKCWERIGMVLVRHLPKPQTSSLHALSDSCATWSYLTSKVRLARGRWSGRIHLQCLYQCMWKSRTMAGVRAVAVSTGIKLHFRNHYFNFYAMLNFWQHPSKAKCLQSNGGPDDKWLQLFTGKCRVWKEVQRRFFRCMFFHWLCELYPTPYASQCEEFWKPPIQTSAEQSQEALHLLGEMGDKHLKPNLITFNAAVSACHWACQMQAPFGCQGSKHGLQASP